MHFIDRTLNDSVVALQHLRDSLNLLEQSLGGLPGDQTVKVPNLSELVSKVGPIPRQKGKVGPHTILDKCSGREFKIVDKQEITVKELTLLTSNAGIWCDAIKNALGDPVGTRG